MRTIAPTLLTALTQVPRRGAECVILLAEDGTVAGFTTWSSAVTVDLAAHGGPSVSCLPRMTLSAVTLASGFDSSNFEVEGALGGEFTRNKILGGKWRRADAWLVRVSPGTEGYAPMMRGRVASARVEGSSFVLEVRNATEAFNDSFGRVLSPLCTAEFGGPQCGAAKDPYPATVTAVQDGFRFTVDEIQADAFFSFGTVEFLTGELAGTAEQKVFKYTAAGGIEMNEGLIATPQVGDTLNLYRGCSKLLKSVDASLPTCLDYDNVENFRGWPEVPGSRYYHKVSAPGTSYA